MQCVAKHSPSFSADVKNVWRFTDPLIHLHGVKYSRSIGTVVPSLLNLTLESKFSFFF